MLVCLSNLCANQTVGERMGKTIMGYKEEARRYLNHSEQLEAENQQLRNTIKTQGDECKRRHELLCGVKEIVDAYFCN